MMNMIDLNLNSRIVPISNLSFDHPLSDLEMNGLIETLSAPIALAQVYFKDDVDIDSIEKVKLLLEGLPNIDDAKIEKYIMKDIDNHEKEKINNMSFINIDTWNVAYSKEKNRYSITSLAKYRMVNEWIDRVIEEVNNPSFSLMDKVCSLYDKVKLLEYDSRAKYGRIPEIICDGKANSYGYNLLFKELLYICDIPAKIEKFKIDDEDNFITMVVINDDKYEIDGVYFFDPSSDTISHDQYKNNLAKRINYNFFAMTMDKLKSLKYDVKYFGILKALSSVDEIEFRYYLDNYRERNNDEEIENVEKVFGIDIENFYLKTINSNKVSGDKICTILAERVDNFPQNIVDKKFMIKTISDNYEIRDSELFGQYNVKLMSKHDRITHENQGTH